MRILAIVTAIFFSAAVSSAEETVGAQTAAVADSSRQTPAGIALPSNDSVIMPSALPVPLCTLDIATEPAGATVTIDGQQSGASPVSIENVAAGKHTILLKKTGFYQKKAVVDLPAAGRTPLSFQLSAPGCLSIVSEPAGAVVSINGKERGVTPYIDSLLKPGIYHVSLRKDNYNVIEDSMALASGGKAVYKGVFSFTSVYNDSLQQSVHLDRNRKKRINIGIIGGAFVLFLLTIALIESKE